MAVAVVVGAEDRNGVVQAGVDSAKVADEIEVENVNTDPAVKEVVDDRPEEIE
jgi:hypothetical protein